jgi:drug/metabolite transporter (DMT)-like permease
MIAGGKVNRAPSRPLVHGAMLLSAFLVSTSFTVGKAITATMDPVVLTMFRFLLATILFTPLVHHAYGLTFPGWRALGRYSLISGALVGFFWLMFLSLRFTQPMNTGVIFTTVPGISGVFSWFLVRERLGGHRLLALALAMTGALWVIFEGNLDRFMALQLNHGDLIFFGGCLMMALYMPLVKLFHRGEPMAMMTLWILVTGSLWLLLFSLPRLSAISWTTIPLFTWLGIAYLAFFTHHYLFHLPVGHPAPGANPGHGLFLPLPAATGGARMGPAPQFAAALHPHRHPHHPAGNGDCPAKRCHRETLSCSTDELLGVKLLNLGQHCFDNLQTATPESGIAEI